MIGGSSVPYLARTPCVPLFSPLCNRAGNRRAFRLPGEGGGSCPLCNGAFARSYSVSTKGPHPGLNSPQCGSGRTNTWQIGNPGHISPLNRLLRALCAFKKVLRRHPALEGAPQRGGGHRRNALRLLSSERWGRPCTHSCTV